MSWTDERIEELRKLWADGLSASQIANTLGGVSRNAVIGKIHRLGLSGRVKSTRPARRATAQPAPVARAKPPAPAPQQARVMAVGATAVKVVEREMYEPEPAPQPIVAAEVVPIRGGITLDELKASSCRWPVGDPSDDNFRFCGARTDPSETYCSAHSDVAFPGRTRPKK